MNVYDKIIKILNQICIEENQKVELNFKIKYEVLQLSNLNTNKIDSAYLISKFYNENFYGNADFMHIPNFIQALESFLNYPIIIAREEGSKQILGISILKYFESDNNFDPYFPIENVKYFSITGILTNVENKKMGFYGIGKKIYEILLKAVLEYKKICNDIRLMCVIDCRNNHSIDALRCATNNLNSQFIIPQVDSTIVGYYKVEDQINNNLIEAPTFVVEIKMDNIDTKNKEKITLKYDSSIKDKSKSYLDMQKIIDKNFICDKRNNPIKSIDPGCGIVTYYPLLDNSLNNLIITSNGTELGNDRVPTPQGQFNLDLKKDLMHLLHDNLYLFLQDNNKYDESFIKKYNL